MAVIIDKNADKNIFKKLNELELKYYKSTSLDFLYFPVNTHPDMQIHFVDAYTAVVSPSAYEYYKETLPEEVHLFKGTKDPGEKYPQDCAYNVVRLGNRIIGNLAYVDETIKSIYTDLNYEFINVRQGYTKCNLCIVDSNSVITEDEGLSKALKEHNIDVLKISPGQIQLSSFDYGFIGGASGYIDENTIGFFGNLALHKNYKDILDFITSKAVNIISLSETYLNDYGSIMHFVK